MKKIISLLILILFLSVTLTAYAGDGAIPDSDGLPKWAVIPVVAALCGAIGILYNELIKTTGKLAEILASQNQANLEIARKMTGVMDKTASVLAELKSEIATLKKEG